MSQFNFQNIIDQVEKGRTDANAANEARFTEIRDLLQALVGRSGDTYDQVLQNLNAQGRQAKFAIQEQSQRAAASAAQDLTSRGLGNTTITSSVNRGIMQDAFRAQQNVDEQVSGQRAQALENRLGRDIQTTGMLSSAIERRNDIGPDLSLYANLLAQAAAAGAGQQGTGRTRITIGPGSSSYGALGRSSSGGGGGGSGRTGVRTFTNQGEVTNGSFRPTPAGAQAGEYQPEEPEMQSYYRPGLLGWSDARGREFASAGEAKAAGYNYIMRGYNDYVQA